MPPAALRFLRSRRRAGFTLVELLVAAGITVLIAGAVAAIVRNISGTWSRASTRLGADAQARIVLDQLQLDLQGAMFHDDGNVWFAVDLLNGSTGGNTGLWQTAQRNAKPAGGLSLDLAATRSELRTDDRGKLEHARYGTAGVWLRFFTTSRGTNTSGTTNVSAPVAVGYQIIRRYTATNSANTNTGYLLHRAEVRPAQSGNRPGVLESGFNITSAAYTTSNSTTNNGSTTGDPRSVQVPGSTRNLDSVLADNVIDFGVRCYVRDSTVPGGLRLIYPATSAGALTNSPQALRAQLPSNYPSTAEGYNFRFLFPDVVDVMVRILTEEGATAIANIEKNQTPALTVPQKYNGNAQQWWWGLAQENSRVYTRRIVLNAKPL